MGRRTHDEQMRESVHPLIDIFDGRLLALAY